MSDTLEPMLAVADWTNGLWLPLLVWAITATVTAAVLALRGRKGPRLVLTASLRRIEQNGAFRLALIDVRVVNHEAHEVEVAEVGFCNRRGTQTFPFPSLSVTVRTPSDSAAKLPHRFPEHGEQMIVVEPHHMGPERDFSPYRGVYVRTSTKHMVRAMAPEVVAEFAKLYPIMADIDRKEHLARIAR